MTSQNDRSVIQDPAQMLTDVLEQVWHTLCCSYDAMAGLPDVQSIFSRADLSRPSLAAQTALANMLLEVMDSVGRFSAWYTRPARAFGLTSMNDPTSPGTGNANVKGRRWFLAPEAISKWHLELDQLSEAIDANYPLIQAMLLVEGLMDQVTQGDVWVHARCGCSPPRIIQVTRRVLEREEIICQECLLPYK
jgi:hypothetical protein